MQCLPGLSNSSCALLEGWGHGGVRYLVSIFCSALVLLSHASGHVSAIGTPAHIQPFSTLASSPSSEPLTWTYLICLSWLKKPGKDINLLLQPGKNFMYFPILQRRKDVIMFKLQLEWPVFGSIGRKGRNTPH